jgi:hypothetical protein
MTKDIELWGTLTGLNVTRAQRWCSVWADLLFADMALLERGRLDDGTPPNMFHRRALWESAVVSYGRCTVSDQKREVPFKDLVIEVAGHDGLALHERIMDWRHGHVAHRKRAEFEAVETVLAFAKGPAHPTALRMILGVDLGPGNDGEFVTAFQQHVKTLRDAMYEKKLRPLGISIIDDLNAGRISRPSELRPADDWSSRERYVVNHCLVELGAGERIR